MQTYNSLDQSNRKKYTRKDIERLLLRTLQANKFVQWQKKKEREREREREKDATNIGCKEDGRVKRGKRNYTQRASAMTQR